MKPIEQRRAAAKFAKDWAKRQGNEKKETQKFWNDLLENVYGVKGVRDFIFYEDDVKVSGATKWIDARIPTTKVYIEQKSKGISLDKKIRQSGDIFLTPYEQAKRYADHQTNERRPDWIVTCNFEEFHIHNLNSENMEQYETVRLCDLEEEFGRMKFLQDIKDTNTYKEVQVSRQAGELIGEIYDKLLEQYGASPTEQQLHQLNILCVRLVFCLYAEDSDIFDNNAFLNYLAEYPASQLREKLLTLFDVLNTPRRDRSPFLDEKLKAFPWVNGGLFGADIDVPPITEEVRTLLLDKASRHFNWRNISPTIFGAMFESTLNPETRHDGGMHYTSIENIHKVIDPLFLDDLKAELDGILEVASEKVRKPKLAAFQQKLGGIRCLDPACGSGNFLTETYMSLRELENKVIAARYKGQRLNAGLLNPIEVNISQFYGIEINDFAVAVAKTAMWIAEYQMWAKTMSLVARDESEDDEDGFLPLKSYNNIHHGNALRTEWSNIVRPEELTYIVGNPPFVGKKEQTKEQKSEVKAVAGKNVKKPGVLDYVSAWYLKATSYMQGTNIGAAFVSTNSIAQGEQVPVLWKELLQKNVTINFAHQTFVWESETENSAAVNCVIIGFSCDNPKGKKLLFTDSGCREVNNINGYLVDMDNVIIGSKTSPINNAPACCYGSMQLGDNRLSITEEEISKLPKEAQDRFVRKYIGGDELINGMTNWCLWLKDASPKDIRQTQLIAEKVKSMREYRLSSTRLATNKLADIPHLFGEIRQPDERMLVIPKVSSERREYIPMTFVEPDVIISGSGLLVAGATNYDFGILTSSVHMAWMRAIGGRLEMRYQYSASIVYNNFPWPEVSESQRNQIGELAQAVLDARAAYPDSSLADLYDPDTVPPALRKAHKALDRAVLHLYGLKPDTAEADIVRHLLMLYKTFTEQK